MTFCKHEVMRAGGYWTGRKCGRTVTWAVTFTNPDTGEVTIENFCGIHKNFVLRTRWRLTPTAAKIAT